MQSFHDDLAGGFIADVSNYSTHFYPQVDETSESVKKRIGGSTSRWNADVCGVLRASMKIPRSALIRLSRSKNRKIAPPPFRLVPAVARGICRSAFRGLGVALWRLQGRGRALEGFR